MPLSIAEINTLFNSRDKYLYCQECGAYHLGSLCSCVELRELERELDSVYDARDDDSSQINELEDEVAVLEDTISELRDDITGLQRQLDEERDE